MQTTVQGRLVGVDTMPASADGRFQERTSVTISSWPGITNVDLQPEHRGGVAQMEFGVEVSVPAVVRSGKTGLWVRSTGPLQRLQPAPPK